MSRFALIFIFFLFFYTTSTFEIIISSNESSQPEKLIFNSFSEATNFMMDQENLLLNFLTNVVNDKLLSFESKNIEMM